MSDVLHAAALTTLADAIRNGRLRARDVLEHHLARLARLDPPLGTFVFLDADGARAAADAVDARVRRGDDPGPLAGVPFGVKELEDVAGWPHPRGARVFADAIATTTSTHVSRLRAAGAVPVGLTASPEMGAASFTASLLHGVCRNPWNPARTPGGSSGGSAAAVAAGLVPFATGSDSGGSLRIPAAFTGLVGFKGTYGRVPRGPRYVGFPNVRSYGVLTRSVADTARVLDSVVGPDEHDPLSLPHPGLSYERALAALDLRGTRVAWTADLGFGACEPAVARVARAAADGLVAATGMVATDARVELADPEEAWRVLMAPDLLELYAPFLPARAADVNPTLQFLVAMAAGLGMRDLARAALVRDALVQSLAELFERVDLVLLPTTPIPAFAAEGPPPPTIAGRAVSPLATVAQTYVFNLSGHPAVSVPAGAVDGAPIGLQIVARRHDDLRVLAAARALERERPWPLLAPE
ncbi:MAG: amidase [Deltaproteobacteria bacterium]|nr:amidase [Deltaproteobacteria bacterium]